MMMFRKENPQLWCIQRWTVNRHISSQEQPVVSTISISYWKTWVVRDSSCMRLNNQQATKTILTAPRDQRCSNKSLILRQAMPLSRTQLLEEHTRLVEASVSQWPLVDQLWTMVKPTPQCNPLAVQRSDALPVINESSALVTMSNGQNTLTTFS